MNSLSAALIGQLIGLARATDGNEHLISERSTALIRECLAATPDNDAELAHFMSRVEEAKRAMVPDCFFCANPCGKTAAFDLSELETLPADVQNAKYRILERLLQSGAEAAGPSLYRGLIALGTEGLSAEFLESIEKELTV